MNLVATGYNRSPCDESLALRGSQASEFFVEYWKFLVQFGRLRSALRA